MTDATPEQMALARKIVSRFVWTPEDGDLSRRTGPQQATARGMETAALAAIIETTERAAKLCEWPVEVPINNEFARGMAISCTINRDALRNQEHLKND